MKKQKIIEAVMDAVDRAGYDPQCVMGHIDDFYVDAPSSDFSYNSNDELVLNTQVYSDYSVSNDTISLLLSLKDMSIEEIVTFLQDIAKELEK